MSGTRWSTVVAAITKDGGPIGPHPDPETQRLHTENPPKRRCPVPAPKNDHYEAPLHIEDPPEPTAEELTAFQAVAREPMSILDGPPYTHIYQPGTADEDGNEPPPHTGYTVTETAPSGADKTINEIRAHAGLPPIDLAPQAPAPNPPSRRGWRRLFRRAA